MMAQFDDSYVSVGPQGVKAMKCEPDYTGEGEWL